MIFFFNEVLSVIVSSNKQPTSDRFTETYSAMDLSDVISFASKLWWR